MDPFLAQIVMFGGNFAPRGWSFCDGQLLSIASNTALFSILGTTFGGDGRTTFALPDLRGRVAIHSGNRSAGPGLTPRPLGQRSGQESVTLNQLQIPSHTHFTSASSTAQSTLMLSSEASSSAAPVASGSLGKVSAPPKSSNNAQIYNGEQPYVAQHIDSVQTAVGTTVTVQPTGGSQAHNNMQPFNTVNYIIAMVGTFPSRS